MIRNNKWKLLISSGVILLPTAAGLLMGILFPERMAAFGVQGGIMAASALLFLAAHWLSIFLISRDPRNKNQSGKVFGLVLWICPAFAFFISGMVYLAALGEASPLMYGGMLLVGLMFVIIGNYLPKCRQNATIGIRVPWALSNEENWNATHRFCGKAWVAGGFLLMGCVFLPEHTAPWVIIGAISLLAIVPAAYSYQYYRRQVRAGTVPEKPVVSEGKGSKAAAPVTIAITCGILAAVFLFVSSGGFEITYGETELSVNASCWNDLTVAYRDIEEISYQEDSVPGTRTWGFGSSAVQMGTFHNDEYGSYTRYTYAGCGAVILTVDGKTVVLSGKDPAATAEMYRELLEHTFGQ